MFKVIKIGLANLCSLQVQAQVVTAMTLGSWAPNWGEEILKTLTITEFVRISMQIIEPTKWRTSNGLIFAFLSLSLAIQNVTRTLCCTCWKCCSGTPPQRNRWCRLRIRSGNRWKGLIPSRNDYEKSTHSGKYDWRNIPAMIMSNEPHVWQEHRISFLG